MEYLFGKRKNFEKFLEEINSEDKVGIITHTDTDGIVSGLLMEKLVESKGISVEGVWFLDLKVGMFDSFLEEAKKKKLTKIFITDMKEDVDVLGFNELKDNFDFFLIDHHPSSEKSIVEEKMLKTRSGLCASYVVYDLLSEDLKEKWRDLAEVAVIMDYSFKDSECLGFLKEKNSNISEENVFDSLPGRLGRIIANSIIYFEENLKKVYDLLAEKNFEFLEKYSKEVDSEIKKFMKEYKEKSEYFPEKNIYFYFFEKLPRFRVISVAMSFLSNEDKNASFISVEVLKNSDKVKVSARNQNKTRDMNNLLRFGVEGLEKATAGGHVAASGGTFLRKDFEKFKERILNL
jgi:single-stranded DNA-specific DHH superfamily exonuclease